MAQAKKAGGGRPSKPAPTTAPRAKSRGKAPTKASSKPVAKSQPTPKSAAKPEAAKGSRTLRIIGLGLILAAIAAATAIAIIRPGHGPGPEFVTRQDDHLMLDGEPFYYASTNTYELMYGEHPTVDAYFTRMNDFGFNVLRTWAFYDVATEDGQGGVEIANKGTWFQYFDPETGAPGYNDGPNGLEKLDYVIYSAGEHGIKLILPLVNNWTSFGGIDQYVQWADGMWPDTYFWHDDFINDETIKSWYKAWVSHILNRENTITGIKYKDDPTIMMWELANEMRCSSSGPYNSSIGCRSSTIVPWVEEMADYVKSIDTNHLVSFGSEGFLCDTPGHGEWYLNCSQSGDPVAITALDSIDLHGIHLYPDHWDPQEPTDDWAEWGVWWIERQAAIANDADKPFYIGEYGWRGKSTRLPVFNEWLQAFYDNGGDGSNFWMMQPTNPGYTPADNDGFVVYCPSPVCTLVSNWNSHVQLGTDWNEFGPISDQDVVSIRPNTTAVISILDNDMAFGDSSLDTTTVDLDPATGGIQSSYTHDLGVFEVDGGILTFTPNPDATGTARIEYTVSDTEGRTTEPVRASVIILGASS
jgi:mannan endo-1,4-beta-mannosidase